MAWDDEIDHDRDCDFPEDEQEDTDNDHEWRAFGPDYDDEHYGSAGDGTDFADPGGNSALRAATRDNPRNLPCPTCDMPNRLTPADRARGYQCDSCADRAERGFDY